jgi:hypothetical protein
MKGNFSGIVKQDRDVGWRSAYLLLLGALALAGCMGTEKVEQSQQATQKAAPPIVPPVVPPALDTVNPTVAIGGKASFATSISPLNLAGTASDNVGVTQVVWSNSAGGSGTTSGTTSWSINGIVLKAGLNTITVTARDAAGNSGIATVAVTFSSATGSAPTVTQATGTFAHGGTVTITGTGFSTKAQAAPLVWDDASGTNVLNKWSGYWPDGAPTPSSNMQYLAAPVLGVKPPHNRVGRYLTGAHEDSGNFHTGQDVAVWKDFNKVEGGYLYLSYYSFVNPGWVFTGGMTPEDGNFKTFGYSVQGSIYELPNNWYEAQWDGQGRGLFSQTATSYETIINDDSSQLNGGVFWGHMINPIGGAWVKREILIKTSSTNGGAITITENNGTPSVTYTGITDPYAGIARSAGPGGFARSCNSVLNRRYFADLYMDTTPQRVVLANNVVYAAATITELQIPTSWSDTSIGITVNLGAFSTGQTAYLFVFDSTGTPSALGFPVTVQ